MNGTYIKNVFQKVKGILNRSELPQMLLLRIISAFFLVSCAITFITPVNPVSDWREYLNSTSLLLILLSVVGIVVILSVVCALIPKRFCVFEPFIAIGSVLCFNSKLLLFSDNIYLAIGFTVVTLVISAYALGKTNALDWFDKHSWKSYGIIILIMAVAMVIYISVCSICRYYIFKAGAVDFGLFVQMFHSLADNLTAVTSCERDTLMSHFNVHSSYIFYLLVPIFKLFPYEETLLTLQALLVMSGVIPLILIAKNRDFKGLSLLGIGVAYVFCASLVLPCFYDFHENAFLPTLLMWALWAVETKRIVPFYIFSVLTCLVKEDAPLFILCIGLYMFFENKGEKKRLHGVVAALLSGAYMFFITNWLTAHGDGQNMTMFRFGHLLLDPEGGIVQVTINSLKNPAYLMSMLIREKTLIFFLQVMLPLLFLPFITKKIHRFMLMIPFVITNLIVGAYYGYAADIGFQYILGPVILLIYMAVINIHDMSLQARRNIPVLLSIATLLLSVGSVSDRVEYFTHYLSKRSYYVQLDQTLDTIPENAVIGGDSQIISHLCDRKEVYIFDNSDIAKDKSEIIQPEMYDFIVLYINTDIYNTAVPLLEDEGFTLWKQVSDSMAIYKNSAYTE